MNVANGLCPTLRATYYKIGVYNVLVKGFPAVMEVNDNEDNCNTESSSDFREGPSAPPPGIAPTQIASGGGDQWIIEIYDESEKQSGVLVERPVHRGLGRMPAECEPKLQ